MQRYVATLLAASFGMLFASTTQAALVVTEVAPQTVAGTSSAINGDWWELTNFGAAVTAAGVKNFAPELFGEN